jgi:hypothetical protein
MTTMLAPLPVIPMAVSEAIAREEGFYVVGSRANRNHNPGNIEMGPFAEKYGAVDADPRFAIFPNDEAGFAALKALLLEHYKGLTIAEAIAKWAPPGENDTASYVRNICAWTEKQPVAIIDDYV